MLLNESLDANLSVLLPKRWERQDNAGDSCRGGRASERVVLIDCDPQESTTRWGVSRDQDTPFVAKANPSNIGRVLAAAAQSGYTLAILDCPPHMTAGATQLVATADYVIIPCQPTALDVSAVASAIAVVQASRKPFAFAINRAPYRAPENQKPGYPEESGQSLPHLHQRASRLCPCLDWRLCRDRVRVKGKGTRDSRLLAVDEEGAKSVKKKTNRALANLG